MANQKISEMTAASALTGAELLWAIQSSADRKATVQQILDAAAMSFASALLDGVDSEKSSDATPALDATLRLTLATGRHLILGGLVTWRSAGGIQVRLAAGTATIDNLLVAGSVLEPDPTVAYAMPGGGLGDMDALIVAADSDLASCANFYGFVDVTVTGTFGVSWAQTTPDADPSIIERNSWIAALRIGAAS